MSAVCGPHVRNERYYRDLVASLVGSPDSMYKEWYFLAHERVRIDATNRFSEALGG